MEICWTRVSDKAGAPQALGAQFSIRRGEPDQLIHLPANREHAYRVASDRAHYYLLLTPSGLETFFQGTGTVLDQPFEGDLPIPGPVSQEKVSELVDRAHAAGRQNHRPTTV
jgi:hypothetical protein